jgi:hypothetical protein
MDLERLVIKMSKKKKKEKKKEKKGKGRNKYERFSKIEKK